MHVIIVRHGIAHDRLAPDCPPDPDRALTVEGLKKTSEAARGLARLRFEPAMHFTSPYVRARQTAALFREVLAPNAPETVSVALLPEEDPSEIVREISSCHDDVALYGHAPNLDRVAALLTGASERAFALKKSGVVIISFVDHPIPGQGELITALPPRVLRLLADTRSARRP
jgi:phosphohistidine phosphatase